MKSIIIVTVTLLAVVAISAAFMRKSIRDTETQPYAILKKYDAFEVRKYDAALYTSVNLNTDTYDKTSGTGFRVLAGYIFGGNEENKKIAMTSPVSMEIDDTSKMSFLVPAGLNMEDMPKPTNNDIYFEKKEAKIIEPPVGVRTEISWWKFERQQSLQQVTDDLRRLRGRQSGQHEVEEFDQFVSERQHGFHRGIHFLGIVFRRYRRRRQAVLLHLHDHRIAVVCDPHPDVRPALVDGILQHRKLAGGEACGRVAGLEIARCSPKPRFGEGRFIVDPAHELLPIFVCGLGSRKIEVDASPQKDRHTGLSVFVEFADYRQKFFLRGAAVDFR